MPTLIDVHSHIWPRTYLDALRSRDEPPRVVRDGDAEYLLLFDAQRDLPPTAGLKLTPSFTDLDEKLRFMDSLGIAKSVVSVGNPWLDQFAAGDSVAVARAINTELAGYEATTGGRVVGMGVLPAGDLDLVVKVAEEVADDPRLHGVVTGSRIAGHELDDPALEGLWTTAAARGLAILVHPHYSAAQEELTGFGPTLPVAIGNPFEITIALARLVLAGVLDRHPNLTLIVSHGGGTLPYLAARLDAAWRINPALHERLPHAPSDDLRKLFLDSIVFHERSMRAAADLVGADHLVFGTDHPFAVADPAANIAALGAAFGPEELARIGSGAAQEALAITP